MNRLPIIDIDEIKEFMDPSMLVQYPDVITKQFAKFVSLLLFDVTTF